MCLWYFVHYFIFCKIEICLCCIVIPCYNWWSFTSSTFSLQCHTLVNIYVIKTSTLSIWTELGFFCFFSENCQIDIHWNIQTYRAICQSNVYVRFDCVRYNYFQYVSSLTGRDNPTTFDGLHFTWIDRLVCRSPVYGDNTNRVIIVVLARGNGNCIVVITRLTSTVIIQMT